MKYNSASDIDAYGYDLVIETSFALPGMALAVGSPNAPSDGKATYVMRYDRSAASKDGDVSNFQHLPVWQIKKIVEYVVDDETYTEFLYPDGCSGYHFVASEFKEYTYAFEKEKRHTLTYDLL